MHAWSVVAGPRRRDARDRESRAQVPVAVRESRSLSGVELTYKVKITSHNATVCGEAQGASETAETRLDQLRCNARNLQTARTTVR